MYITFILWLLYALNFVTFTFCDTSPIFHTNNHIFSAHARAYINCLTSTSAVIMSALLNLRLLLDIYTRTTCVKDICSVFLGYSSKHAFFGHKISVSIVCKNTYIWRNNGQSGITYSAFISNCKCRTLRVKLSILNLGPVNGTRISG